MSTEHARRRGLVVLDSWIQDWKRKRRRGINDEDVGKKEGGAEPVDRTKVTERASNELD